ncbi:hypothetical protein ABZ714_11830 [Streptomyces sp. NPDC006798]|uniref:hypothetical protein n=1 Tax=Streptomyces sp. NPDC006798 TaxID=3155462 RepID=UPI0033E92A96
MSRTGLPVFRGRVVPWITPWSDAPNLREPVVLAPGGRGIAYADEGVHDRTDDRVLIARGRGRRGPAPGSRPLYEEVDGRRQRRSAQQLLCQVCGRRPAPHPDGPLWLFPGTEEVTDGSLTEIVPLCPDPCAALAVRQCPSLVRGHRAVRVRYPQLWGFHGLLYGPDPGNPGGAPVATTVGARLPHDDPRLPWLLMDRTVTRLIGCTPAYDVGNAS